MTEIEDNSGVSVRRLVWSGFKLFLGIAAVSSFFLLQKRLEAEGCRYAVTSSISLINSSVSGAVLFGLTGRELLKHRFTGYLLDLGYVAVTGFILLSSAQGMNALEENGCDSYYRQFTGVDVSEVTVYMNSTEYKNYREQKSKMAETGFSSGQGREDLTGS